MSEWLTAPDAALQAVLQVGERVTWRGQDGRETQGTVAATSPLRLRVESVAGCSAGVAGIEYQFSAAAGWPCGLRVVGAEAVDHGPWHPDMPLEYRNQIVTGDARELARRIPDASVDLVFTDPVYERVEDYRWLAEEAARVLKPGGALLAFCGAGWLRDVLCAVAAMPYRALVVWNLKGPGNKRYGRAIDNGAWLLWWGGWPLGYTPLVWDSFPKNGRVFHWQKNPVLTQRHITDFAPMGGTVWDPFAGSGSTAAACRESGRNYIASEIDPETATLARERVRLTPEPLFILDAPEPLALDFEEAA